LIWVNFDPDPEASNDTPEGRVKNRCVEITVRGPGASGSWSTSVRRPKREGRSRQLNAMRLDGRLRLAMVSPDHLSLKDWDKQAG